MKEDEYFCTKRHLSSKIKIVSMAHRLKYLALTLLLLDACLTADPCQNGGDDKSGRCVCSASYLGEKCQLSALRLSDKILTSSLTSKYNYFYFTPT